jgi:hypothetical protein
VVSQLSIWPVGFDCVLLAPHAQHRACFLAKDNVTCNNNRRRTFLIALISGNFDEHTKLTSPHLTHGQFSSTHPTHPHLGAIFSLTSLLAQPSTVTLPARTQLVLNKDRHTSHSMLISTSEGLRDADPQLAQNKERHPIIRLKRGR